MFTLVVYIAIFVAPLFFFLFARSKLLLMFFQQDEYDNPRFLRYVFKNGKLVDKKFTCILLAGAIVASLPYKINLFFLYLLFAFAAFMFFTPIVFTFKQTKLIKNAKKTLVVTARVKRILIVNLLLCFYFFWLIAAIYYKLFQFWDIPFVSVFGNLIGVLHLTLPYIITVQLVPFTLVLSNIILSPYEKHTQRGFIVEAKAKLAQIDPTIIGITGSYGKTSTKHILAHITSSSVPIFFPPGGVNTPMGITRVIR